MLRVSKCCLQLVVLVLESSDLFGTLRCRTLFGFLEFLKLLTIMSHIDVIDEEYG